MDILIIIAKSAGILTIFYVLYQAILQKDTFYTANRHYLLAGIIAALVIPFIEFTKTIYIDIPVIATAALDTDNFVPMLLETAPEENALEINWWMVALVIYGVGVSIMIGRLLVQLYSLHSLLNKYPSTTVGNFTYVKIADNIAPFSFFRYICYNPKLHTQDELQMIIAHEKVHAVQLHTIDVLLMQVALALQWINPLAWYYKKSLEQNLEFLADSGALQAVHSSKAYQHTLVKVSSTALRPALTNQFYHSLIKKRIVMLNKETSRRRNLLKLGVILPLLGLFMYSFNVKEVIEYREVGEVEETAFAKANTETSFQEFIVDKTISRQTKTTIKDPFRIKITKDYTKERLDALKVELKKEHNVTFTYSDLDFNDQGEIIAINIVVKDDITGNTTSTKTSGTAPMNIIIIERRENGGLGVRTVSHNQDIEKDLDEFHKMKEKSIQERREAYDVRREELTQAREEKLAKMKEREEVLKEQIQNRSKEMKERQEAMEVLQETMKERQKALKERREELLQTEDRGYVTLDNTTYYFANINGQTKFFDRFGVAITKEDPLYDKLFKKQKKEFFKDRSNDKTLNPNNLQENALYILNGVEYKKRPLDLDPNNIEEVTVLKDKTATSLYGKRGKNGVVIIVTKN